MMNERDASNWDRLDHSGSDEQGPGPLDYELPDHDGDGSEDSWMSAERDSRRSAKQVLVVLVTLGVLLVIAAAWWWWGRGASEPPAELGLVSPEPALESEPPGPMTEAPLEQIESDPVEPLPPLSASDELVRRVVAELSTHPKLASLLATEELVARIVRAVANVAYGEDPRIHLRPARPEGEFAVEPAMTEPPGAFTMTEESKKRYDPVVAMFVSLDTVGTLAAYRRLEPLFEQAYSELGLPGSFETALQRASNELRSTPDVEEPILRRGTSLTYSFDDERLEELSSAQKILLRMGPENRRRVLAKIEQFQRALDAG